MYTYLNIYMNILQYNMNIAQTDPDKHSFFYFYYFGVK